jgi:hypothetical protein
MNEKKKARGIHHKVEAEENEYFRGWRKTCERNIYEKSHRYFSRQPTNSLWKWYRLYSIGIKVSTGMKIRFRFNFPIFQIIWKNYFLKIFMKIFKSIFEIWILIKLLNHFMWVLKKSFSMNFIWRAIKKN